MASADWKSRLERFFVERSLVIEGVPTLYDHCIVSAKDPYVSANPEIHADMIASILATLRLSSSSDVLEVGCASGYVACGLATCVRRYTGVDLAAAPLEVARRMNLANARFLQSDGASLPFENGVFDAAFAYDVFTNFPDFDEGVPLIREMLRVVKPGGTVMVGSVTDKNKGAEFAIRVSEVAERAVAEKGPLPKPVLQRTGLLDRMVQRLMLKAPLVLHVAKRAGKVILASIAGEKRADKYRKRVHEHSQWLMSKYRLLSIPKSSTLASNADVIIAPDLPGEAIFYYYNYDDFLKFSESEGVDVRIEDVHPLNPYVGFRHNIIFVKP